MDLEKAQLHIGDKTYNLAKLVEKLVVMFEEELRDE